jgi:hypothetical protein
MDINLTRCTEEEMNNMKKMITLGPNPMQVLLHLSPLIKAQQTSRCRSTDPRRLRVLGTQGGVPLMNVPFFCTENECRFFPKWDEK